MKENLPCVCLSGSQVEQLFRLGLRSRSECEGLLQDCQWNLEQASTVIMDTYGAPAQRLGRK